MGRFVHFWDQSWQRILSRWQYFGVFSITRRSNYERTKRISTLQWRTPSPHVNHTIKNTFHSACASSFSSIPLQLWSKLKQRKCTTEEISSKGWQRKLPLDWWETHFGPQGDHIDALADRCCVTCGQNCFGKQCHQAERLPHLCLDDGMRILFLLAVPIEH